MSGRRLRAGELLALLGAICVIVSLFEPWYENAVGRLSVWDTFGGAVVLLLAALCAALAMIVSALSERGSTALPVSTAVWCVLLGVFGFIGAIVRVIERPEHATRLCAGSWLAFAGAILILVGAWMVLRDERPSMYEPALPEPRPRP